MVLKSICPPALIYLVFSITQVAIDTFQGMYNMAFMKLWVALVFTILLNYLCVHGLGVISWIIVFIPFILMTIIVTMLLVMFGLNPSTGKMKSYTPGSNVQPSQGVPMDRRRKMIQRREKEEERRRRQRRRHRRQHSDTDLSGSQKHVLNDMVQTRTGLSRDPLQHS